MNQTQEIIGNLTKQIELVKEFEQSRLFEKADFIVEHIGRGSVRESENDYWFLMDKTGRILENGTRTRIDRWINWRKLEQGKVYFKI